MSRLTQDGTDEPVSRDQIFRHERGQGNIHFSCSADHELDWQPYPVDSYIQEKEWMGCFLEDLRAFGINADQWMTAAQDEGEWRRTAEQGAEHFMAKWIVAEKTKAGLRHAVVCPNVTGRTKGRIAQSKRARAGSLALVD